MSTVTNAFRTFDVLVATLECIRAKDPQQDAWSASAQTTALSVLYLESTEASYKAIVALIRYVKLPFIFVLHDKFGLEKSTSLPCSRSSSDA